MKQILVLLLAFTLSAFAHDEGHGPKLTDASKQGGIISPVILAKEANIGTKAQLKHKAEIVRTQDGTVRVYFYDQNMNPLKTGTLSQKASGNLITKKKGKVNQQKFNLQWKDDHFEGKSPKPARKPYNIDIKVMEGNTELLVAFDNLD
jgi:hypothetical protein